MVQFFKSLFKRYTHMRSPAPVWIYNIKYYIWDMFFLINKKTFLLSRRSLFLLYLIFWTVVDLSSVDTCTRMFSGSSFTLCMKAPESNILQEHLLVLYFVLEPGKTFSDWYTLYWLYPGNLPSSPFEHSESNCLKNTCGQNQQFEKWYGVESSVWAHWQGLHSTILCMVRRPDAEAPAGRTLQCNLKIIQCFFGVFKDKIIFVKKLF